MNNDEQMLISYVREGDLARAKVLLSIGANANAHYKDYKINGWEVYVAWIALLNKDFPMFKALLEHGAYTFKPHLINGQQRSMFNYAITLVNNGEATTDLPLAIAKHSLDINDKTSKEDYPLVIAIKGNYTDVVDDLLLRGANPNKGNPLAAALNLKDEPLIKKLLIHGALPNANNVCAAINNNQPEIINLFIKQIATKNITASDKKDVNFCLVTQPGFMELSRITAAEAREDLAKNTNHYHDYQCHSAEDKAISAFMNDYGYYELICSRDSAAAATAGHDEL